MNLPAQIDSRFPAVIRSRALDYRHRVRILDGSATHVRATVRGQCRPHYDVDIVLDGTTLRMSCECPYFESEGPCKHLYATLCEAQRRSFLSAAAGARKRTAQRRIA